VLIRGKSGAGKSDLALRLIDGGAALVADDYCETSAGNGALSVTAPEGIAGKLEIRGFGIIKLPARAAATVGLVVDLAPEAEIERLPESTTCMIEGIALHRVAVDAFSASAAAKVRLALRSVVEKLRIVP
jgi:HPr kinase/phosphorylase